MFKNLSIQNHIFRYARFCHVCHGRKYGIGAKEQIQKLVPVVILSQLNFIFLHCF